MTICSKHQEPDPNCRLCREPMGEPPVLLKRMVSRRIEDVEQELHEMMLSKIGCEYAIQMLRMKCGLPINGRDDTDCMAVWEYIDQLQKRVAESANDALCRPADNEAGAQKGQSK